MFRECLLLLTFETSVAYTPITPLWPIPTECIRQVPFIRVMKSRSIELHTPRLHINPPNIGVCVTHDHMVARRSSERSLPFSIPKRIAPWISRRAAPRAANRTLKKESDPRICPPRHSQWDDAYGHEPESGEEGAYERGNDLLEEGEHLTENLRNRARVARTVVQSVTQ
eukprot:1193349-Prorocentrum_minimum.AAC.1